MLEVTGIECLVDKNIGVSVDTDKLSIICRNLYLEFLENNKDADIRVAAQRKDGVIEAFEWEDGAETASVIPSFTDWINEWFDGNRVKVRKYVTSSARNREEYQKFSGEKQAKTIVIIGAPAAAISEYNWETVKGCLILSKAIGQTVIIVTDAVSKLPCDLLDRMDMLACACDEDVISIHKDSLPGEVRLTAFKKERCKA